MLPKYYKIRVYNDAGVAVTVQVDWMPYKVGSSGTTFGSSATPIASASISSAGNSISSAVDNSAAGNQGVHVVVTATPASAPSGNKQLLLYLLGSIDNSSFEDIYTANGEGYGSVVLGMSLSGTSAQHQVFEIAP